jgi:hypothetical protein
MMSGFCWGWFCRFALLISQYGYLAFLTCLYCFWWMLTLMFFVQFYSVSLHMLKCSWAHTVGHVFLCTILLPLLGMLIWCGYYYY